MLVQILLLGATLCTVLYFRLAQAIAYAGGVPRFGKPGVLGYILAALRWTLDAEALIIEGRKQFNNGPFVIPTLSGNLFFLPPKHLESVRTSTDSVFNQPAAINDFFQMKYTMDEFQLSTPIPYQTKVMQTNGTRAIPTFIPDIHEEYAVAIQEAMGGKDSVSLPVFDALTYLIARICNRVFLGKELSRNENFIHAVVTFAESMAIAPFIQWSPSLLRPFVYFLLSSIFGGKKGALKYLLPHLKKYAKDRSDMAEKPKLIMEYLLQVTPADEPLEVTAVRLLDLNFASIHTSSVPFTHAFFEIALLSEEEIESIRMEVKEALKSEGGWTKGAIDKFYKLDSALREIGRFYNAFHFVLPRVAAVGYDLEDGKYIPPGSYVGVDVARIHFDPEIYPDPYRCDLFRFAKLRGSVPSDSKYSYSTVDAAYLPFGAGRHACPGRWFASVALKLMLAHIILDYDLNYPPGITTLPKNVVFNGAVIPNRKAHLVFKRRSMKKAD